MTSAEWKIIGPICGAIVGLFGWFAKHISNTKKHPSSEDLVYNDVCVERAKANELAHKYLKGGIDAAIAKSDEQHRELKTDMRDGFTKIQALINSKL